MNWDNPRDNPANFMKNWKDHRAFSTRKLVSIESESETVRTTLVDGCVWEKKGNVHVKRSIYSVTETGHQQFTIRCIGNPGRWPLDNFRFCGSRGQEELESWTGVYFYFSLNHLHWPLCQTHRSETRARNNNVKSEIEY